MIEEAIKENTAAVIDLTAAIQELAAAGGVTTEGKEPSKASAKKTGKTPAKKTAKTTAKEEEEEEEEETSGDDLLGGEEEEITYDMLRELAQNLINGDAVEVLRKIVKTKLKAGSLSDLDEDKYEEAHKLLTAAVKKL